MSEISKCESCRFNSDNMNYAAGGDCNGCKDGSDWRELKRVNEVRCETCLYCDDPCHYICVECQDTKNWTPRPSLKEEVLQEIEKQKNKLQSLEQFLIIIQKYED